VGLVVGISRFLSFRAPERISSRYARAPGGYERVIVISGSGESVHCVLGRRLTRGLPVDISRFLSVAAPETISSRCARAPGGYGLVFDISGPGDSLLPALGRRFNMGLRDRHRRSASYSLRGYQEFHHDR
jgi:hypothetical protein